MPSQVNRLFTQPFLLAACAPTRRFAGKGVAHGVCYEPATLNIPPGFFHRNPRFGDALPA